MYFCSKGNRLQLMFGCHLLRQKQQRKEKLVGESQATAKAVAGCSLAEGKLQG